jgi:hypothetical protein
MTRILASTPPRALVTARRLKHTRHALGALSATAFGAAAAAAALGGGAVGPLLAVAVTVGLAAVGAWAGAILAGRAARRALFAAYSVAPRQDGMFELLLADGAEPHSDLAASTEVWRVYSPDTGRP